MWDFLGWASVDVNNITEKSKESWVLSKYKDMLGQRGGKQSDWVQGYARTKGEASKVTENYKGHETFRLIENQR